MHKNNLFTTMQYSARNDIERAFGVLQVMCHIIKHPSWFSSVREMRMVMKTVIILHNMMDEERCYADVQDGEKFAEGLLVSSTAPPMWEGLLGTNILGTRAKQGTLAATFKMETMKDYLAAQDIIKRLLLDHLRNHHKEA